MRNTVIAMLTASTLVAAAAATPTNAYSQVIIVVGNGYAQPNYAQPYPYLPPAPYQQPAPVIYNYAGGYGYPGAYAGLGPVIYNYSGGYGYPAAYAGSYNGSYRPYWGW